MREAAAAIPGATAALDMGTGGGERLAELRPALTSRVVATEQWHVNAPVARDRLAPLGVAVVRATNEGAQLPFADGTFDLVINRHEEFDPTELTRVLRPGGRFVTQQVGMHNWRELSEHIPRRTDWGDTRSRYVTELQVAGVEVTDSLEHDRLVAYPTLGEFVYQLACTPWEIEGFDVERDLDALLALERATYTDRGLVLTECRYIITARKAG